MAVNHVEYGDATVMDIRDSSVTPETLLEGETAYDRHGEKIFGLMPGMVIDNAMSGTSENAVQNKVIKQYVDNGLDGLDIDHITYATSAQEKSFTLKDSSANKTMVAAVITTQGNTQFVLTIDNETAQLATEQYVQNAIPAVVSAFTNDSGYQTAAQVLTAIANELANFDHLDYQIVQTLPQTGASGVRYLLEQTDTLGNTYYEEYIYIGGSWRDIGRANEIHLEDYYTKAEIATLLADKANTADLPTATSDLTNDGEDGVNKYIAANDVATDADYGLVKLNSSEDVTLDANGNLLIGGRLGQTSQGGIYHAKDREPRDVGENTFLITDALGMSAPGSRSFGILTGQGITLSESHAAGSTTYTVQDTFLNRLQCAGIKYLSVDEATSKATRVTEVTSVTFNGSPLTPTSAENSTTPIVITCAESANPNSAVTQLRAFRQLNGYGSVDVGNGVGQDGGGGNLVMGQHAYSKTGNMNTVIGQAQYNQGNGNALFGRYHISMKNRWLLAGTGHDNTNGRSEAGTAVGQYSDITARTIFAVGNGTNNLTRSNAFEVLNDGRVKSSGTPSESDDLTTKAYVDNAYAVQTFGNADFTYLNDCVAYSTVAGNANEPTATKCGRIVNLAGAIKTVTAREDNQPFDIGKVPTGCEPLKTQYLLNQGSTQHKFMLTIRPDGTINCSRYSTGASSLAVAANTWLNINATYISAT